MKTFNNNHGTGVLLQTLLFITTVLGVNYSVSATELTLKGEMNGSYGVIQGYHDLSDSWISTGLAIADINVSDYYNPSPNITVYSNSPLSGPVIPTITADQVSMLEFWGSFQDTVTGGTSNLYQLRVFQICANYPGFVGPLTVHSSSGINQTFDYRMLTCT